MATLKAERYTVESAITTLDSLTRQVKAAVEAGIVTRNDLLKVDLKRNGYRADLVDLDNGIELMKRLLAQEMGLGGDALGQTADHRLLEKNVEAKQLEKKMETGSHLPQVGVGAGWFYHDVFEQNHDFGGVMVSVSEAQYLNATGRLK